MLKLLQEYANFLENLSFRLGLPPSGSDFQAKPSQAKLGRTTASIAVGLPVHSARFPAEVPRRIILTTTVPGGVVYDPMAGSNVTGWVAEQLGRQHISSEVMLRSVQGAALRFEQSAGFQEWPLPAGMESAR